MMRTPRWMIRNHFPKAWCTEWFTAARIFLHRFTKENRQYDSRRGHYHGAGGGHICRSENAFSGVRQSSYLLTWWALLLFCSVAIPFINLKRSVTPLDVVRVRLQSQPNTAASVSRNLPSSSAFGKLPPNLGVTACCREVFWVNNTSSFCIVAENAVPSIAAFSHASSSTSLPIADCAVDGTRQKTFNSTFDGLRKIARNEGLGSLWRGLSPTLVMAIPANVIYFTGYDYLRFDPKSPINTYIPDAYAPLMAGSTARVAAATAISPIEMFRTRMQAATTGSNGRGVFVDTFVGLKKMVHAQGYTSLWRGLTLTMWRDVPFSGIYWWGYETVRNALTEFRDPNQRKRPRSRSRGHEDHASTFVNSFVAGATSGAVAAIVTTPFDVGKTRRQVREHARVAGAQNTNPRGHSNLAVEERPMLRFLYQIWADEGLAGLFRGWAPRCLKVAPACAIMISSYEIGKKMAKSMNEKKRLAKEWELGATDFAIKQ